MKSAGGPNRCAESFTRSIASRPTSASGAIRPVSYFNVEAGQFAIFYPADPHSPMSGHDRFLKPVVKIAVDWK